MESKSNKVVVKRSRRQNRQKQRTSQTPATKQHGLTAHADLRFNTPLFPPRFKKKLFYCENGIGSTSSAGLCTTYFFSANGMFDPNVTGTGHQPMGFDQMMLMYEQYSVTSAKISVTFVNASASNILDSVGLYLSPDTTNITVISRLLENGNIVWTTLMPVFLIGSVKTLSLEVDIATYFGKNLNKRAITLDSDLYGTAAANPNEQCYFGLLSFDPTGTNVVTTDFVVEIEYEAIFWEPRKLTQS